MIVIKNSIEISISLEKVFAFMKYPENFPKWNYYLNTVQKVSDGSPVIGTLYHQIRKSDEQYFSITGFKENELIELTSKKGNKIKFRRVFVFSVSHNGCLIDDHFEINTGLPSFINRLLSKKPQKAVKENLVKLKELLEDGQTILQDGRLISL